MDTAIAAADRLFRCYANHCLEPDPDTLFAFLNALHIRTRDTERGRQSLAATTRRAEWATRVRCTPPTGPQQHIWKIDDCLILALDINVALIFGGSVMFRARSLAALLAAGALTLLLSAGASAASLYSQGFETDTSGWLSPTRVSSGTDGVSSASGSYHAETAQNAGDFTRWGGYNNSTGGSPGAFQPYTTSLDIYLNVGGGAANDTRFDFTNAINDPSGNFLRDFVFNVGFYDSTDNSGPGAGSDRFIVSASNNAGRANAFPKNPGKSPISIGTTGWYTFQESFFDNGGSLGVTLSILDSTDATIASWLLGGDPIGSVGGNRYGWFAENEFSFLAIDNASLTAASATPLPAALPLFATGFGAMGLLGWRRKRKRVAAV